jgi:hypothetical protein
VLSSVERDLALFSIQLIKTTMMIQPTLVVLLILALFPFIDSEQETCPQEDSQRADGSVCALPQLQCRLVVAPSTISGAGLGIFTTVPLKPKDLIGYGDNVIPIERIPSSIRNPFEDYSWNGRIYGGPLDAFTPGLQSLMNSNQALLNVHQVKPAVNVFPDSVDATKYHYLETIAEQAVPAGGELFTFYGDHWFQGRERFTKLPLAEDFPVAENLSRVFPFKQRYLMPFQITKTYGKSHSSD